MTEPRRPAAAAAKAGNPVRSALTERNVSLPAKPLDLAAALAAAGITRSYVIVMTGRCGSTWLAEALHQLPDAGYPLEYFSNEAIPHFGDYRQPQSFESHFAYLLKSHGTGTCFGFKSSPRRLLWLDGIVDLARTFGASRWLDMRRWDLVRQGFSFARARKSNVWHDQVKRPATPIAVSISDAEMWDSICNLLVAEQTADRFFRRSRITPLRLYYEEILAAPRLVVLRAAAWLAGLTLSEADLDKLTNGTRKLPATPAQAQEEEAFIARHVDLLNDINMRRATCDVADLRRSLALRPGD